MCSRNSIGRSWTRHSVTDQRFARAAVVVQNGIKFARDMQGNTDLWQRPSESDMTTDGASFNGRTHTFTVYAARRLLALVLLAASTAWQVAPACAQRADDPAAASIIARDALFHPPVAKNGMVAAEDGTAAEVGVEILRKGGNAVDAAVATGFTMAVTHPQAGNLGGGGFMLIALPARNKVIALDYREMAPAAATRDLFLGANGEVDNDKARFSRASAGIPGTVAGLIHALETYGTMSLADILAPAIRLAEDGIQVPRGLAFALAGNRARFEKDPSSDQIFHASRGPALRYRGNAEAAGSGTNAADDRRRGQARLL